MLKDEGDRQAHDYLVQELQKARPDAAVLSEEGFDDAARIGAPLTWIIDPLDGTQQFAKPERTDWGVHVGLVANNRPIAGAVTLPALGKLFSTAEELTLPARDTSACVRVVASRSRTPGLARAVAQEFNADLVTLGSAGAKAMAVVSGECDIYVHSGGQYEWDSCAPVAVALAACCHVSRLDGSMVCYNQPNPYLPDILICRPEFAQRTLDVLVSCA